MPINLSDSEWKLMNHLWEQSPRTITELTAALKPETGWSKNTVITMLARLEAKGAVLSGSGTGGSGPGGDGELSLQGLRRQPGTDGLQPGGMPGSDGIGYCGALRNSGKGGR